MNKLTIHEEKAVDFIKANFETISFTGKALRWLWALSQELFEGPSAQLIGTPLDIHAIENEDGVFIERLDIKIESVETIEGERWITGGGYRLNFTEFNRVAKRAFDEFIETKVDRPDDVTLEEFMAASGI